MYWKSFKFSFNSRVYYCFFKRSTCSLFHNVFPLRYGFSYCLYRFIYFLPIHLKCPSHSSVTCSCQVVLLCFPPCWMAFQLGASLCGVHFPWESLMLWGVESSLCSLVCLSVGRGSGLVLPWIGVWLPSHSSCSPPEIGLSSPFLGTRCLSFLLLRMAVYLYFGNFDSSVNSFCGHIDLKSFYRIIFSISFNILA